MSINSATVLGRVGKDPEVREAGKGKVAQFSLATGGKYTTKDGREVDDTAWHNIVAWNSLADRAEKFIRKGNQVCVIGRISYREYTDNNGNKRYITEIIADTIELCGGKNEESKPTIAQPAPRIKTTPIGDDLPPDDSGLPF